MRLTTTTSKRLHPKRCLVLMSKMSKMWVMRVMKIKFSYQFG